MLMQSIYKPLTDIGKTDHFMKSSTFSHTYKETLKSHHWHSGVFFPLTFLSKLWHLVPNNHRKFDRIRGSKSSLYRFNPSIHNITNILWILSSQLKISAALTEPLWCHQRPITTAHHKVATLHAYEIHIVLYWRKLELLTELMITEVLNQVRSRAFSS